MTEADMKVPPTPEPSRKTAEAKDIKCLAMRSQEESKMYITKCVVSLQPASPTSRQFLLLSNFKLRTHQRGSPFGDAKIHYTPFAPRGGSDEYVGPSISSTLF